MKISVNSNMYTRALDSVLERHGENIFGDPLSLVCVVSNQPLPAAAQSALWNAFERLGYGSKAGVFVTLQGKAFLTPNELFTLVEGLDPYSIVISDEIALAASAEAYRHLIEPDQHQRIFGRDVCALTNFTNMLESEEKKQYAWSLLKKLPRID